MRRRRWVSLAASVLLLIQPFSVHALSREAEDNGFQTVSTQDKSGEDALDYEAYRTRYEGRYAEGERLVAAARRQLRRMWNLSTDMKDT